MRGSVVAQRARGVLRRALVLSAVLGASGVTLLTRAPVCPMAGVFGIPCPGCGLTRATLALVKGDFTAAFRLHPLVFVVAPLVIGAALVAVVNYLRGPVEVTATRTCVSSRASALTTAFGVVLLVALLGVWGGRFLGYFGGPVPVQTFAEWSREYVDRGAQ